MLNGTLNVIPEEKKKILREIVDISLDIKNAKLKCNNNELQISGKELELLEQLLLNKNKILSKDIIQFRGILCELI